MERLVAPQNLTALAFEGIKRSILAGEMTPVVRRTKNECAISVDTFEELGNYSQCSTTFIAFELYSNSTPGSEWLFVIGVFTSFTVASFNG